MGLKQIIKHVIQGDDMEHGKEVKKKTVEHKSAGSKSKESADDFMEERELKAVIKKYQDKDREKVWAFFAGQYSQDFRGNPKYLFVYINRYRPDISAYWVCSEEETVAQVRDLGFEAYKLETPAAQYMISHTGVVVAEQVKLVIPEGFRDIKYVNLWHGVGFKRIERKLFQGDIAKDIAKKYVRYGTFYRDNQLMVVTSPTIEKDFTLDCGLDEKNIIRSGYLRCMYQQKYEPIQSFEHDLRKVKGLPADTKLVVYAPTYRAKLGGTFSKAMPDLEKLYRVCEENGILLIFKVHPNMEKEVGFIKAGEVYGDRPYFWFWDNQDDFYEIMHEMDVAIVDYSAIFSDMLAVGIRKYIRYIFDYEDYISDGLGQNEYYERTTGKICSDYDALLDTLAHLDSLEVNEKELADLSEKMWAYAGEDDFEKTIQQVLDFKITKRHFPSLYSFDIFDTLFSRKVLDPAGVFYAVRERMMEDGTFPFSLVSNYPSVRHTAEFNVREYYRKTQEIRNSEKIEISFDEIFAHLQEVYILSDEQVDKLKRWELEIELDNVIPLPKQIDKLKRKLDEGNKVVLVSDMYLPREIVVQMLEKADPLLATLPLFLSSDYGVQKTTQNLFFEVYKSFEPYYDFEKWVHYGDNLIADVKQPWGFKINTRHVDKPEYNEIQTEMVRQLGTYDAYLVAGMQARMYENAYVPRQEFVSSYVALCMVPYIDWVLRDAQRRGYQTLYFISRDGHHLKRIADAIIEVRNLPFKTKYIYASRRVWRIPSYIHQIDEEFWLSYGNFGGISSTDKLFHAMDLTEQDFVRMFPFIDPYGIDFDDKDEILSLVEIFKNSGEYREYLLEKAAQERKLVSGYLEQEMEQDESFAVVEYWGRGYTQDCMMYLWQDIVGEEVEVPFYYCRSILPTQGKAVRHNFTTNDTTQFFMEAIFANMPYKSVQAYQEKDGRIEPVLESIYYDQNLYDAMQEYLPQFARNYASLDLRMPADTDRLLHEFAFDYYQDNRASNYFVENISTLVDSVAVYGAKRQFAPPYTMQNLEDFAEKKYGRGVNAVTSSITMSYLRSDEDVQKRYREMYQIMKDDNVAEGTLLTEEQQEKNRNFKNKYRALQEDSVRLRKLYEEAVVKTEVREEVVLVSQGAKLNDSILEQLKECLDQNGKYVTKVLLLGQKLSAQKIVDTIVVAKYIVVTKPIGLFSELDFREESKEVLLRPIAFPMHNQGLQTDSLLKWKKKYISYAWNNDISVLQIPSDYLEERFRSFYCNNSRADSSLRGCCATDIYFDAGAKSAIREKLNQFFPEAADKRVLLYMPTIRENQDCPSWMSILEMDILQKLIGQDYVVVLQFEARQLKDYKNRVEISGFSKLFKKEMPIRELMVAADVIVGDYRDIFFESALLQKPVYSTAYDYESYARTRTMTMSSEFEQYLFCPLVESSTQLAQQLQNIDVYDYTAMREFTDRVFSGCDGHSLQRVVDYLLEH